MKATARANKPFGYKAVIVRENGSTYQPVRHNFKTRDEAIAYAEKWMTANNYIKKHAPFEYGKAT